MFVVLFMMVSLLCRTCQALLVNICNLQVYQQTDSVSQPGNIKLENQFEKSAPGKLPFTIRLRLKSTIDNDALLLNIGPPVVWLLQNPTSWPWAWLAQ